MVKSILHGFAALVLGALLAVSMSLYVARAGDMPAQTTQVTMGSDMDSSAHRGCDSCEAGKAMALACVAVCAVPGFAVLPAIGPVAMQATSGRPPLPGPEFIRGSTPPPAPFPPRTTYIG